MDKTTYENKLEVLISDAQKFKRCDKNQTKLVKDNLNKLINELKKDSPHLYYSLRRVGDYKNGHLYGLPKIHKNANDPPLRPIISMCGTVTHEISQYLNSIIRPYIDTRHMINSGDELLIDLQGRKIESNQKLVSLDVTSLFTNVPVMTTINLILEKMYRGVTLPPPKIPESTMKQLLQICTTETPFSFKNETFIQTDGVSMGSPLGPTFADMYMSEIENKILLQPDQCNPQYYRRYVDDILAIFNSKEDIETFKSKLQRSSVLEFTHEEAEGNSFHFLDVSLLFNEDGTFQTTTYIKPTDKGLYTNFNSHTHLSYKKSVIKTLIRRATKYCSTWELFDAELRRIKQILVNNDYPLRIIDDIANKIINSYVNSNNFEKENEIPLYVQLFNVSCMNKESGTLEKIVKEHVTSSSAGTKVKVKSYFRPKKLSSLFSTREKAIDLDRSNCVYKFQCEKDGCKATYIGHTTCTVLRRAKQHRYKPSNIHCHYTSDHECAVPPNESFLNNFSVVRSFADKTKLKIAEALIIREVFPSINVKNNELSSFLNLYR